MLRKLLKHELRATGRIMLPLYLILILAAVCANFSMRVLEHSSLRLLNVISGVLIAVFFIALIGVGVMSLVLMIQRFWKNLMSDEGYIMFTLPASVHQQIWSKIIASVLWFIATGAVTVMAFVIMSYSVGMIKVMTNWIGDIFKNITVYYALNGTALIIECIALMFVSLASFCLQFYAAMALGHSLSSHKILLSVVFFVAIQLVLQISGIYLLVSMPAFGLQLPNGFSPMQSTHLLMGAFITGSVVIGAVFYVITTAVLKKRLNLE